jgi:hypothetical protein
MTIRMGTFSGHHNTQHSLGAQTDSALNSNIMITARISIRLDNAVD